MGADGGTIPKRCELVRNKKKKEKIAREVTAATKWKTCQLTQLPLKEPIVACKLGRLYNKEAVLEAMLDKSLRHNEVTKHIKSLSDVKELRLTRNRAYKDEGPDKGDVYIDVNETQFVCPVTALGMSGINTFFVNWDCGCVFSEKAIVEAKSDTCHGCAGTFNKEHLVTLYPDDELLKVYQERVAVEQSAKKSKKHTISAEASANAGFSGQGHEASTSNVNKKLLVKMGEKGGKRKADESLQSDPTVSKVLKSLFTSSEEAKKQPKGHWVTHNPLYY